MYQSADGKIFVFFIRPDKVTLLAKTEQSKIVFTALKAVMFVRVENTITATANKNDNGNALE